MDSPVPKPAGPAPQDLTGKTVDRYVVRERLGAGGMGEVYRADDTLLKRSVALKRIAPELREDPYYRQRFLKEAERASKVSDPHIAGIHDVVEVNGDVFLVMEYVEGQTLRGRFGRPMPLREFLPLAIQCAEAMAAAHAQNLVHCDIKPENLIVTNTGRLKVLDFGVARPMPAGTDPMDSSTTAEKTSEHLGGTMAYMAPETLLKRTWDVRSDLWSLGVVFYEALAGQHPFRGETTVATCNNILHATVRPLHELNSEATSELERVLEKLLAKEPDERYASAADLLVDLRGLGRTGTQSSVALPRLRRSRSTWRIAAGILALLLASLAIPQVRNWVAAPFAAGPASNGNVIAVLPLEMEGSNREAAAMFGGLEESLSVRLAKLARGRGLEVVPTRVMREEGVRSVAQARSEFGVHFVVDWSLHRSGESYRVTYALVDAQTGRSLDGDSITVPSGDSLGVEDAVVGGVARMLDLQASAQTESKLEQRATQVAGAYDFYLQGRGYAQNYDRPENLDSAIQVFERAIALDDKFALAYAGLGEAYWKKFESAKQAEWVDKARKACERALQLDSRGAAGHVCLGTLLNGTGEYERAAEAMQKALDDDPMNDEAYRGLGRAYEAMNQPGQAERTYKRAIEVRPHYWAGYSWLGGFYFAQGRFDEAAGMFKQMVALAPDSFWGYSNLGGVLLTQGRYAEAIEQFKRSAAIRPTAPAFSNLATAYFALHQFEEAADTYAKAIALDERNYLLWGNLGEAQYWSAQRRSQSAASLAKAISLAEDRLRVNPRDATLLGYLAMYHALRKETAQADGRLKQALALAPRDSELYFKAALLHQLAGRRDVAVAWVKRCLEAGYPAAVVRDYPAFDPLRDDPSLRPLFAKP